MTSDVLATLASLLALLVTIVGWFFTFSKQKQLLTIQMEAERERTSRQFFIPAKIDELQALKKWFKDGIDLVSSPRLMEEKAAQWFTDYFTLGIYTRGLRCASPIIVPARNEFGHIARDTSGQLVTEKYSLAMLTIVFFATVSKYLEDNSSNDALFARQCLFPAAMKNIDELIEQTATSAR